MAESSIMWTTGGAGDGTNPYTMAQVISWLDRTLGSGIHLGYTNECEPTEAAPNVAVDSGAATIHGFPYENTAALNVNIPNAGAGDERIDRIVLRASWAAQTVRVTNITGVEAPAPVAPAITQNDGVTWDEMICQARVTDAGVITVTDERIFSDFCGQIQQDRVIDGFLSNDAAGRAKMAAGFFAAAAGSRTMFAADFFGTDAASRSKFEADFLDTATLLDLLEADGITNAVLLDAILNGAFQADAASRALFANLFVNAAMLDNDSVSSAKIIDGAIVNVDINAAAAIDQSKISNAAPAIDADTVDLAEAEDLTSLIGSDEAVANWPFGNVWSTVQGISVTINNTVTMGFFVTMTVQFVCSVTSLLQVRIDAPGGALQEFVHNMISGETETITVTGYIELAAGARVFTGGWKCAAANDIAGEERIITVVAIPV